MSAEKIELFERRFGSEPVQIEGRIKIPYSWSAGKTPGKFFDGLSERKVYGMKCQRCQKTNIAALTGRCPFCRGNTDAVELGHKGKIRAKTSFQGRAYVLIQLDGADACLLHRLLDSTLEIGHEGRLVFENDPAEGILKIKGVAR